MEGSVLRSTGTDQIQIKTRRYIYLNKSSNNREIVLQYSATVVFMDHRRDAKRKSTQNNSIR